MKFWWILVILALLLLLWGVREDFQSTQSVKSPPYDDDEKERIYNMVRNNSATPPYRLLGYQTMLMTRAKALKPEVVQVLESPTSDGPAKATAEKKLRVTAGGLVSPAIEEFFKSVYTPASTPITPANIDTFMATRTSDLKDIEKDVLTTYFIGQSGVGGSDYAAMLAGMGQTYGYARQNADESSNTTTGGTTGESSNTTGGLTSPGSSTGGTTGESSNTTGGLTSPGSSTGGTSDTFSGPTTRQSSTRGIFGPEFGGFGQSSTGNNPNRDSSQSNSYPNLLGGGNARAKTLVDGAGLVDPSKNWQLTQDGSLPDCAHLGCNENSKYLPSSRVPGDMDLIADPYRVAQSYVTSSYSFKTDPVPFLTDFSAFQR